MLLDYNLLCGLSESFGDAFYLLDSDKFRDNYSELTNAFSNIYSNFNIAYSYKTNYTPKFCKIVNQFGGYAEVVSDMEMELALRIGVHPKKIIWNGPIKNEQKVAQLLLTGGTVNVDSFCEMALIHKLAEEYPEHILNIGIRCNFDIGDGVISRFGFDIDHADFNQALSLVKKTKNLYLINVQCHFAKRSIEHWPGRAKGILKVLDYVSEFLGYMPKRIDLGGGIYGKMEDSLKKQFKNEIPTYADYANAAATVIAEHFSVIKPELLIEPGSALVGDCMKFVGKIETIKAVHGKYFITMLGSQKNISMGGVNPPIEIIRSQEEHEQYERADIVGYTCIEDDVIYRDYSGELAVGDYIVISNCGSYSIVMKPPFIMPNFPVIDISGGKAEVIKRGETFYDVFHTFLF